MRYTKQHSTVPRRFYVKQRQDRKRHDDGEGEQDRLLGEVIANSKEQAMQMARRQFNRRGLYVTTNE